MFKLMIENKYYLKNDFFRFMELYNIAISFCVCFSKIVEKNL